MRLEDLTDREFGKWKVLYRVQCDRNATKWKCVCACGITKDVYASHLKSGKSNGCHRCFTKSNQGSNHKQFNGHGEISGAYWSDIKKGANGKGRRKEIEFSITKEYIWGLYLAQDKKCALTGLELHIQFRSQRYSSDNHEHTASLDRIDSSLGYIDGNVQWVHKDVNMMKRTYDQDYFIKMCKLVAENNK